MEQEYIIKESEVGLKYVDGKLETVLKPGRYRFGVHQKELTERIEKARQKREAFMEEHFDELTYVEPSVLQQIETYESQLKIMSGLSATLTRALLQLLGRHPAPTKKLAQYLEQMVREHKVAAYGGHYANAPAKIREQLVALDKEVEDAANEPQIVVEKIETRQLTLSVTGQEMVTQDKATIRINAISQYRVMDAKKAATSVVSYQDRLYQQIQMVVRDYASANTLDQLLTNKGKISRYVKEQVEVLAESIGLEVVEVGIKDIILPGAIGEAMNKVVQAEREGKAAFVRAREEVAAARAMANAAKIISSDPNILKLKQIEALKEIAKSPAATIYFGVGDDLARAMQASAVAKAKK